MYARDGPVSRLDACGLVNGHHVLLPRLRSLETAEASGFPALPAGVGRRVVLAGAPGGMADSAGKAPQLGRSRSSS